MDRGPASISIVDITDESTYALLPPCADPGFDHRSCDYWEDADRGSKTVRLDWIAPRPAQPLKPAPRSAPANPFLADLEERGGPGPNPFAVSADSLPSNPLLADDDPLADNPFAPGHAAGPAVAGSAPPKLRLLGRGLGIVGSYAKVLLTDDVPAAYCQFGPLTAYPRAQRTRDLYPALPDAPLPAVITCIASTQAARGAGLARMLVAAVCDDLETRGFAAVETYPEMGVRPEATSAATPAFWETVGFVVAAPDERFPVMRRELG